MTTTKRIGLALLASSCIALPAAAQDLVISNARILDGTGTATDAAASSCATAELRQ